jgi:hypothetical protein
VSQEINSIFNEITDGKETPSDEQMIQMISERVEELLERNIELLMSYLYRLDVAEAKINAALDLSAIIPPHVGIATLIWQRQKERIATKKKYKQDPIDNWGIE